MRAYRVSSRAMLVLRRVTHTPSIARLFRRVADPPNSLSRSAFLRVPEIAATTPRILRGRPGRRSTNDVSWKFFLSLTDQRRRKEESRKKNGKYDAALLFLIRDVLPSVSKLKEMKVSKPVRCNFTCRGGERQKYECFTAYLET